MLLACSASCLRNRHGEDQATAVASGQWVCPPCRGTCGPGCVSCCNCGPCRKKVGFLILLCIACSLPGLAAYPVSLCPALLQVSAAQSNSNHCCQCNVSFWLLWIEKTTTYYRAQMKQRTWKGGAMHLRGVNAKSDHACVHCHIAAGTGTHTPSANVRPIPGIWERARLFGAPCHW